MDSIAIAGATGFVGNALAKRLAARTRDPLEVTGLTRGRRDPGGPTKLVACDLFSLEDVGAALEGARFAVYLVHSMLPSARLVQGKFADLDLICADNFGRAAAAAGVEQIVYLGGLIPDSDGLSDHLASRLEVETALGAHGVPVTTLRAGIVIGPGGSSFEMLARLVRRLPIMITPKWCDHRCQPIDLDTVVALLDYAIGRTSCYGQTFDVGGPDVLSYRDMLVAVGELLGTPRRMFRFPLFTPGLSRLWVSLITGAPRALVAPLIESLHHDMVCRDRRLQTEAGLPGVSFRDAAAASLAGSALAPGATAPVVYKAAPRVPPTGVRSVQRIPLPDGGDAEWAAFEYMRWLPRGAWPPLRVEVGADRTCSFFLAGSHRPLLVLAFARERSAADRQLFHVVGGALARPNERGRLEFRVTPDGKHLLTAIHDFAPRLPWWLYRVTQALVHRWVMARFGAHLGRQPALRAGEETS